MASGTILVVEDNRLVANVVQQVLQSQGYEVLTAASGAEALTLCREHASDISLLLCDVVLPDFRGSDVALSIFQLNPQIEVLFTSGYPLDSLYSRGLLWPEILENGSASFLRKPFWPKELLAMVDSVLGSRPEPALPLEFKPAGALRVRTAY